MNRFLFNHAIKLGLVLVLAATCSVRADNPLETQDRALAGALENHPDIVAAKAKVALANAELYGKRIEVSRLVLMHYGNLKNLDAQIVASRDALSRLKKTTESGGATEADVRAAEMQLVKITGEREGLEKELRLLVGKVPPSAKVDSAATAGPTAKAGVVPWQAPKGPIVEKMKVALQKSLGLDFADVPLQDVMSNLSERVGVTFSLQKIALEDAGIASDMPIALRTNEVPLHAAIEAFQDGYPELHFVLRDYGVLVTTGEFADKCGYMPVLELEKQSAAGVKAR